MKRGFLTLLAAAAFSTGAYAGGYQVLLQSNRSTAMGNVGVGLRPDASSINFNPGAMAMMRSNGVQIGANLIYSKVAFQAEGSGTVYNTENDPGTPFHAFATFGNTESNLRFGLGVYTPFGSSVTWEDNWAGRGSLTSLSLRAIFIQPTVSYKLSDNFSVGAGLIYSTGGVNLQRDITAVAYPDGSFGSSELDGSANGWGYNLGVYFTPSEKFSLGLNYRSRIDMEVEDGEAVFVKSPLVDDGTLPSQTTFQSSLPLPSNLTLGVAFMPTNELTIGLDIARTGWSAYEALTFEFADPVLGSNTQTSNRKYENTMTYRLGLEYSVTDELMLRAGGYYDEAPVPDGYLTPETPDANTIGLTGGFGLALSEKFTIDGSFLFINKEQRTNTENNDPTADVPTGTYKTYAFIPGITLTFNY
jgi:long-chain fatty acid transport protein